MRAPAVESVSERRTEDRLEAALLSAGLVRRFDHVAIAVPDLASALPLYEGLLGGQLIAGGEDDTKRIRTVQLWYPPGVKIELMAPMGDDSYLAGYLARRGPGFHHLTCFVDDVRAAARHLEAHGFETVDTDDSREFWRETYIRPSSGFGALVQLASTDLEWTQPVMPEGATSADVVEGRIRWVDARPIWRSTP